MLCVRKFKGLTCLFNLKKKKVFITSKESLSHCNPGTLPITMCIWVPGSTVEGKSTAY